MRACSHLQAFFVKKRDGDGKKDERRPCRDQHRGKIALRLYRTAKECGAVRKSGGQVTADLGNKGDEIDGKGNAARAVPGPAVVGTEGKNDYVGRKSG